MLNRLYKCDTSGGGGCPSVYAEDGSFLVVGDRADQDPAVAVGLTDLLPGEVAARVPEEVLIGAVEEHLGRPVRRDATSIEPFSVEWDQMLRGFEHTAFKLEVRQSYSVAYEDESLRRFLDGQDLGLARVQAHASASPPGSTPEKSATTAAQRLRRAR